MDWRDAVGRGGDLKLVRAAEPALLCVLALGLAACVPATREAAPLPDWLQADIERYEQLPPSRAPSAIWRLRYRDATAYYLLAPCCDQMNPLLDAGGATICHPSGGFAGSGDGQCPVPLDADGGIERVWAHPQNPAPPDAPPMPRPR